MINIGVRAIGMRVRRWRLRRGLSQRALAELAGFTQGYVAHIEAGSALLSKRTSQLAIAEALQISIAELTGHEDAGSRYRPAGLDQATAALRCSLALFSVPTLEIIDADPHGTDLDLSSIEGHFQACRFDVLIPALADAVVDLACRCRAPDAVRCQADLRHLVDVCSMATSACMNLGYRDLALIAAEQCRKAAAALDEPAPLGVANYAVLRSLGNAPGIMGVADKGIEMLDPYVGNDQHVAEVCGMHHLMAAHIAAGRGQRAVAVDHLDAAERVAAHTGDRRSNYLFGPANAAIWRVTILAALGEGERALSPPAGARPESVPSKNRVAFYHMHRATALLQARRRESEALSALLRAEAIAPQLVRVAPEAYAAVGALLRRSRSGSRQDLRTLADRVGFLG